MPTLAEIETRALDLLQQHRLLAAPVNVVLLAQALAVSDVYLSTFDEPGLAGMIQRKNGVGTI